MAIKAAMVTQRACVVGTTNVRLHSMFDTDGEYRTGIAIEFYSAGGIGLNAGFHGTTAEAREFAAQLIRHCDAADAKQCEAQQRKVAA